MTARQLCKLCNENEVMKANYPFCKDCNFGLIKYKRLIVKDKSQLTPGNIKLIKRMEAMLEYNKQHGGYVPQFYGQPLYEDVCGTCLKPFKWIEETDICLDCRKHKEEFHRYYGRYGLVGKAAEYYDYYLDLYRKGRKVPQLFIDLYTGKKK